MRRAVTYILMTLLTMGLATAVLAASLPRLPKPFEFPQSPDSPGIVTFDHETHVAMQDRPNCAACHSKLFKMLDRGATADGSRILHATMEKKQQCGSCHNGQAATGLDECEHCHKTGKGS
jgi:c(7)-type cytochrome triheme protein